MTLLYRYEADSYNGQSNLNLIEFLVVKETPCGYWYIDKRMYWGSSQSIDEFVADTKKWVSKDARVRKCYETKELAFNSFSIRAHRRVEYLERDLAAARLNVQLTRENTSVSTNSMVMPRHSTNLCLFGGL